MFTVLSYGIYENPMTDMYGASAYNTYTEPVPQRTKIESIKNKQNVTQQLKMEIKKEIKKEEIKTKTKASTNMKNDIKKDTNVKEEKKPETKIVKKEEIKVERREGRRTERKEPISNTKKSESTCRYNKRGGFNIVKKKEKVRQVSTNKNDKGKRNHLTYEVINIEVEKKE